MYACRTWSAGAQQGSGAVVSLQEDLQEWQRAADDGKTPEAAHADADVMRMEDLGARWPWPTRNMGRGRCRLLEVLDVSREGRGRRAEENMARRRPGRGAEDPRMPTAPGRTSTRTRRRTADRGRTRGRELVAPRGGRRGAARLGSACSRHGMERRRLARLQVTAPDGGRGGGERAEKEASGVDGDSR